MTKIHPVLYWRGSLKAWAQYEAHARNFLGNANRSKNPRIRAEALRHLNFVRSMRRAAARDTHNALREHGLTRT